MNETKHDATRGHVLVVEDEEIVRQLLLGLLKEEGYSVDGVASGEEALRALDRELYDLVLLDLNLPGMHGMNVLAAAPALQTDAQFIVMTAFGSVDNAVEAMKLGAYDYVSKPFRTEELLLTLERAAHEAELRREVAQLRRQAENGVRAKLVGRAPAMERMFDMLERVAPTRARDSAPISIDASNTAIAPRCITIQACSKPRLPSAVACGMGCRPARGP